ncbi:DUF58 domain-containing protein [Tissierella pigra]|uniref:DUF58 domain-containing protein n=1 Tax=Tissierella pigra TaxID=2607614 RepID=UPI001C0F6378|nr:DUF58 domain-containing protein [Tissierella pigra]MBU5428227.1 DUF58 domain-containing protein [Tissierella pigra]
MIWFLLGLVVFTYLINKITLDYGFKNLSYRMDIDKRTGEIGEDIEIISTIENKKFLTVFFLKVSEIFPKGFNIEKNIYTLFIMPYQRVRRKYKIQGSKRGIYSINNSHLELGDFIGLKTKHQYRENQNEIIIFPQKLDIEKSITPLGSFNGDISVKRWIIDDPLMTIGIREYTGNESERFIHWPSSLKYNSLMVKNFDFTTDNNVLIALNIESMKPYWQCIDEEAIEKSISITRAIMEEFEDLKIPYGFISNAHDRNSNYTKGHFYHPGLGNHRLYNFLEILGSINYIISSTFEETLNDILKSQGNYTTVVIVTPKVLEPYIDVINSLSKVVNKVVCISIKGEDLKDLNRNILKYRSD